MPGALPFITYPSKHPPRVTSQFVSILSTSHGSQFLLIQDSARLMLLSFPIPLRDPYLIALRSVTLPTHPPTEDYTRGEVLCAGFTILQQSSIVTKVGQTRRAHGSESTHSSTVKAMQLLLVFCFRSPTTTRPHRVSCPTSPQTSLASPPPSTALSVPVVISWRPIRTAKPPCHYKTARN